MRAAREAARAGDEELLVRCSLMAGFGRVPQGLERATPLRAAQHLVSAGRHREAILLFEQAGDPRSAARAAAAAGDHLEAARLFERGSEWLQAAEAYENGGRTTEAVRMLERGERSLGRDDGAAHAPGALEELRLRRAELLLANGSTAAAVKLLRTLNASVRRAELLERAGLAPEAMRGYLEAGAAREAHRVADRSGDPERLLAQVQREGGNPVEAGHRFARLGMAREAAEAYEAGHEWAYAAYRWEAAQQPQRAAQAYEKAGQVAHAARCYAAAGMTGAAVDLYLRAGDVGAAAELRMRAGQLVDAASLHLAAGQKAKAASVLMQVRPSDPTYGLGTVLLAPLLIEEGFAGDALDRLRGIPAGVNVGDADPDAFHRERVYWQGRACEALQRGREAEEAYASVDDHRDAYDRLWRLRQPPAPPSTPPPMAIVATAPPPPVVIAEVVEAGPPEVLDVGGRLAGRYDVLAELGRGGMGRVFRAYDRELGEEVAIKGLATADDGGFGDEARLLKEIQLCRRISHPNVVRVFDLGRFRGGIFLTMELLEGRRLDQVVVADGPLPFAQVRDFVCEIAAGLWEAHDLGIVHRDLKPTNVMVTHNRVKILDFGIAAMAGAQARMTQVGFVMGSPIYMSPDQVLGLPLDGRSDLYSLGLLAYCMITGREPYEGIEPYAVLRKKLHDPPPDVRAHRPQTPRPWLGALARMLAKKPENRFQTAHELLTAVDALPVE